MGKHLKRFAVCFVLAVAAVLCYVAKPQNKIETVSAFSQGLPYPYTYIVDELEYSGMYATSFVWAMVYDETIGSIKICEIDDAYNAWTNLDVSLYKDGTLICNYYYNNVDGDYTLIEGNGYENYILTPGEYSIELWWNADGAYTSGYINGDDALTLTITPKGESFYFMETDFDDCTYSELDGAMFMTSPFSPVYDSYGEPDDVQLAWFYDVDGEPVLLDNETEVGTYSIYPGFVGSKADWYYISDAVINGDTVDKLNPVEVTIVPKAIDFKIRRGYVDMKMFVEGDTPVTNTAYYTGANLPYYADTDAVGVTVKLDCWINSIETEFEEIQELGTYFATWEHVTIVSGAADAKNYYLNKHTMCKLVVEKRQIVIDQPMDAAYTGADYVIPKYSIGYPYYASGEWESDIIAPAVNVTGNLVGNVGDHGSITVEIVDKTHYYMLDMMMNEVTDVTWEYDVMPGNAIITIDQVEDFWHREILTDYTKKFTINVETTEDPEDAVEIESVEWSTNGGYAWYDFNNAYPTADELDKMAVLDGKIYVRVTTGYSTNGNFNSTQNEFEFYVEKAPVYVRAVCSLTYTGNYQKPEDEDYRFFIYSPEMGNEWVTHRPDLPEMYNFVDNVYTNENKNAGTYDLDVELQAFLSDFYELVLDEDATYTINKAQLYLKEFNDVTRKYGENCYIGSAYYDGFVNGEAWYDYIESDWQQTYQYNTIGFYADEDVWLDAEELTTDYEDGNPVARYDTPAGHYFLRCVLTATNYEAPIVNANLFINPRVVDFVYYASETAYNNGETGTKGVDTSMYDPLATYTYDGEEHYPFIVFENLAPFGNDVITPTIYVDNKVDAGYGHLYINSLNNDNYEMGVGSGCCFYIEKANVTVTPDSGISKVYGGNDPELTYTLSGVIAGESVILTGELSRVAGYKAGTYAITQGTLSFTVDAVNDNYNLVFNATPVMFTIEQKEITANFGVTSKEYTSANVNPDFESFTGVINDDKVEINFTNNTIEVGNYTKNFELAGVDAGNYVLTSTTVGMAITPATLNYTAVLDGTNSSLSVEYDGETHTLTVEATNVKANDGGRVAINILTNASGTTAQSYNATLALTGDKAGNYVLAKEVVTWIITPKGVNMDAFRNAFDDNTVTYDGTSKNIKVVGSIPEHYTYELRYNGNTFNGAVNVGTYLVEICFTSDDTNNYPSVPSINNTLTINQREVTVEFGNANFVYDGTNHLPTVTLKNVAAADEGDVVADLNTDGATNKGTYDVTITGLYIDDEIATNYKLTGNTQKTMIISAREITVKANNESTVYGEDVVANENLTAVITEGTIVEGDTDVYTLTHNVTNTSAVNTYTIKVGKGGNKNYDVTFIDGTYTVTKRNITIEADNKTSVYGDDIVTLTAKVTAGSLVVANNDTIEKLVNVTTNATNNSNVGNSYVISVSDKGNANYNVTTINGTYTITKKAITVTIADKTSVYGDDIETLTASYGTVKPIGNDKPYELECEVSKKSHVDEYPITGRTTNNNYDITFVDGTYTITARPITITIYNQTSIYGDTTVELIVSSQFPTVSKITKGKFMNDVEYEDVYELTCEASTTAHVGTYVIGGVTTNNDYDVTYVNGTYTITQRAINVTINNATSVYGNDRAELTGAVTIGNVVNNDNVYKFNADVNNTTAVGTYAITGECLNNDYNVTFVEATYTVTARPITVTIDNESSVYGDAISGFANKVTEGVIVNNDNPYTVDCVNGEATINTTTPAGEYAIVGTCTDTNYDITFVNGVYTIEKRAITVTIDNETSVYGDLRVALMNNVTAGNIVNEDEVYTVDSEVTDATPVGEYAISGTCIDENYDVTFIPGVYTITARPITVTVDAKTGVYGDERVLLTAKVTTGEIKHNDNVYTLATTADKTQPVGEYPITGTSVNTNYNVTFVNSTYTITAREVTLTWGTLTFEYNETMHTPTATAGNLKNGDRVTVTVTGGQVVAGTHTATASELSNANYVLPANNTKEFTITKPASYNKPIDTKVAAEKGVNVTEIFQNVDTTAADAKVDLKVGNATLTFDKTAIEKIAANDNVIFKLTTAEGEDAKATVKGAAAVFEISLNGVEFDGGSVTVTAPFNQKAPFGKQAKLYYVDANGKKTDMKGTFDGENVTWTAPHFSTYAVVYVLTPVTIIMIILLVLIVVGVVVFFILKGKKNAPAEKPVETPVETPAEETPVEATEETTETPAEEKAPAEEETPVEE